MSFYFNFKIEPLCQELHMEYKHACEIEYTNIQIINMLIPTNLFFCNLVLQHKYTYKIKMLIQFLLQKQHKTHNVKNNSKKI